MSTVKRLVANLLVVAFAAFAFAGATVSPGTPSVSTQTLSLTGLANVSSTLQLSGSSPTRAGTRFWYSSAHTLYGDKIAWKFGGVSMTVTVELWGPTGTLVDSATLTNSVDGTYSVLFPTPHVIPANTRFTLSYRSTAYTYYTAGGLTIAPPALDLICVTNAAALDMGGGLWTEGNWYNTSGYPNTQIALSSQGFAHEPIDDR